MPVLGTAFLGMGRGILEEEASTVWDGMGGGPRSAASTPTGDRTVKDRKKIPNNVARTGEGGAVSHGGMEPEYSKKTMFFVGHFPLAPPPIQFL